MKLKVSVLTLILVTIIFSLFQSNSYGADIAPPAPNALTSANAGATGGSGGDTVTPDMFSGTMSYNVPIEVPPGRNGMAPQLNLLYRSGNPNGYMGVGWELEPGAIVRSLKGGINYNGNDYALRMAGATLDLVQIASTSTYNEYRTKIEGSFSRIKLYLKPGGVAPDYWEVTDKSGMKYTYGKTVLMTSSMSSSGGFVTITYQFNAISRQDDPANMNNIFKWCLERVEDPSGNYITYQYIKDQGQIYLDRIDYTGHTGGLTPTNYIKLYWENRTDAPDMYTTNFKVKTAQRLKTIDVIAGASGTRVRAYSLQYDADPNTAGSQYSAGTGKSLLTAIKLYDSNAIIDASGMITGGTTLPASTFGYAPEANGSFQIWSWGQNLGNYSRTYTDVNGDGKTDMIQTDGSSVWIGLAQSNGGFQTQPWSWSQNLGSYNRYYADVNGDGKTDMIQTNGNTVWVGLAQDNGSFQIWSWSGSLPAPSTSLAEEQLVGASLTFSDVNGDGRADLIRTKGSGVWVELAKSDGSFQTWSWSQNLGSYSRTYADVNGDGKTDMIQTDGSTVWVGLAKGDGSFHIWSWSQNLGSYNRTYADVNGDGKADMIQTDGSTVWVGLAKGDGSFQAWSWSQNLGSYSRTYADVNGDGKADMIQMSDLSATTIVMGINIVSVGLAQENGSFRLWSWSQNLGNYTHSFADIDGDGKTDMIQTDGSTIWVGLAQGLIPNLTSITNGIGATTSITYTPSTQYSNTLLPFPVQTVSSVTIDDGNGNIASTSYSYAGGYFHMAEKDFRGFNYVKVTGPSDNGKQLITETWFHQGNDVAPQNNASAATGYMKGRPYLTKTSDGTNILSVASTTYLLQVSSPYYFTPAIQMDNTIYVNGIASKTVSVKSTYDPYGNVTRVENYGDKDDLTDDTTAVTSYGYNTTNWMMGYPASSAMYAGIGTASMTARTDYYYDGVTSCTASSTNQIPTTGKLTRSVAWLYNGVSPEVHMAYDSYGNRSCTQDALGNVSTVSYDPTFTFPLTATNPLGQTISTSYYGVNGVPTASTGLYGQVKSVIGLNNDMTTTEYDTFGRKKKETLSNASTGAVATWTSISYNSFGAGIGTQNVLTSNSTGLFTRTFFDGFGRTIVERSNGPDGKVIAKNTIYDKRGAVWKVSLPYFNGIDTPVFAISTHDSLGRVTKVDMPDSTSTQACYSGWVSATIDANGHKRKETKNAAGKLIQVDEYTGTYTTCDTTSSTIYATTTYQYDTAGNLLMVTDAKNNQTKMNYDTLMRKVWMHDPDMGDWNYYYDANGNMTQQTDAKAQSTYYQYDVLNRIKQKDYLTQKPLGSASADIKYNYDQAQYVNGKGRLTSIIASTSDSISYNYYLTGKAGWTTQSVNGVNYVTQPGYDSAGRLTSLRYQKGTDISTVKYSYNGPFLKEASDSATGQLYVAYSGYNAMGQASGAVYGNGVVTSYQYNPYHHRLQSLSTIKDTNTYQAMNYTYDNVGNITFIDDLIVQNNRQIFKYDELDRLILGGSKSYGTITYQYDQIGNMTYNSKPGMGTYIYNPSGSGSIRPHAVSSVTNLGSYLYDANGNMTSGGGRTFTYDVENRPISITTASGTVSMYYDGNGNRVKKVSGANTTVYIGGLLECVNGNCDKYIFANGHRIAKVNVASGTINYYHGDHLGSSSIITDGAGNKVETTAYYPYGETRSDIGTVNVNHKFTGQEYDAETGLYFYGARYYDPVLGRFISADTIVPKPNNPQTLNRYSYCMNNPLKYTDPSGHFAIIPVLLAALFNGAVAEMQHPGNFWKGFATGAISAILFGWAGDIGGAAGTGGYGAIGNHMIMGGVSGGINASIMGGNVGMGILTGGVAGGFGEAGRSAVASLGGDNITQFLGSTVAGGTTSGIITMMYGGNFWDGFGKGALTAATGYLFNNLAHQHTNAVKGGWHGRVVVLNKNGNILAGMSKYAKDMSLGNIIYGKGEILPDKFDPPTETVEEFITTPREDQLMIQYIEKQVYTDTTYALFGNNCRSFSEQQFNYMMNEIIKARIEDRDPIF